MRDGKVISFFKNQFIEVTVVHKIIWVSSVHFYSTSSVYCIVCLPAKVKSPSVPYILCISIFTLYHSPFPSGNHHAKLMDLGLREHFMNLTSKAREVKTKK